jgi:hypothetical protein
MSAFFILARLGKAVDAYAERTFLESKERKYIKESKERTYIKSDRGRRIPSELRELRQRVDVLEDEKKRAERDRLS